MKISALPVLVIVGFGLTGSMNAQNDKKVIGDAVFTTTEIAAGVDVLFLIRFENTGADTAFNIVVRDTLDPRFNAATFHMVDASHSYQLLHDQGFIRWYFNGIRLPSSDPEEEGNENATGYLMYTVQPHRFLTAGQTIHNTACISFDEETICTNTATIWIDGESEIEEAFNEKRIYRVVPNPNYGHFEIANQTIGASKPNENIEWWITDVHGKVVHDGAVTDMAVMTDEIWMERTAPGLYLLWIKENSRLQVEQFAVIR